MATSFTLEGLAFAHGIRTVGRDVVELDGNPTSTQSMDSVTNTSPSPQSSPGRGAGGLAVLQDERAVDEDVVDAFGEGPAGGVGRAVDHGGGVEDGDIGDVAGADAGRGRSGGTGARRGSRGG